MDRVTDQDLMREVQDGDVASFERIVDRHKRAVFGLCFTMLRSREDAEEASQDTFLKLFRGRDLYDPVRPLQPWILRIAGNTCRDLIRRRSSQPGGRGVDNELIFKILEDPSAAQQDDRAATRQAVRHAVEQMNERFREPLMLRYMNGLTNVQVAEVLGISLSNVKIRLARAKDVLSSRLAEVRDG